MANQDKCDKRGGLGSQGNLGARARERGRGALKKEEQKVLKECLKRTGRIFCEVSLGLQLNPALGVCSQS